MHFDEPDGGQDYICRWAQSLDRLDDIDFDKLASKEIVLLEAFRNVSDEDKQRVIEIVKLFENKQNK